jgi:CRISPR-associated protein Cas2
MEIPRFITPHQFRISCYSPLVIVTYDVSTETAAGRKRLRRVAKVCESVGQRVQKSVFECQVNLMQYEELERRLLAEINEKEDSLRLYRLTEPVDLHIKEHGNFRSIDFEGPLVA